MGYSRRLLTLILAVFLTSCSVSTWVQDIGDVVGLTSVSGVFKGVTNPSSLDFSAQSCASYTASIYKLTMSGAKNGSALVTSDIDSMGNFQFNAISLYGIDLTSEASLREHIIEVEGCGETYRRPLTNGADQNISSATDVLSLAYSILTKNSTVLSAVDQSYVQSLDSKTEALADKNRYEAFTALKNDNSARDAFNAAFGFSIDELGFVASTVSDPSLTTTINEGSMLSVDINRSHWNDDYVPEVQWLIGSTVVGTSEDLNYTVNKNLQGNRTLRLRIGKQESPGLMDVQRPIYEKTWALTVNNNFPAVAPSMTLLSSTLSNTAIANVSINTGSTYANCETFSELLFSEDSILAPTDWSGATTCSSQPIQISSFSVSPGDGLKEIALWARDSAGNVSISPSILNFTLDQTAPSLTLGSLTGGQVIAGSGSYTINYSASDANLASSPISIYVSSDSGANYSAVATNINNSGSYSWVVPNVNSSTYRVRVTATDKAGNITTASSSSDFTISTSAPNITQNLIASTYIGNASSLSVTYGGSCEVGYNITVGLDANPSLTSIACPAGTWTYTTSAMTTDGTRTYTFSQNNGLTASASAILKRDTVLPTISAIDLAGGASTLSLRFIDLSFSAADNAGTVISNITHICPKTYQNGSAAPVAPTTANDSCWINLQNAGISPAQSFTSQVLSNYFFNAYVTDNHSTRAWIRDGAGNISSGYAEDSLLFNVPQAATLKNAMAANSDSTSFPAPRIDLSVPTTNDVYIKWKATAGSSALDDDSVKIYYNTSISEASDNWIEIDSSIPKNNAANTGCSIDPTYFTGCYRWTNTVTNNEMRFKIQIDDAIGSTSSVESNWINTSNYKVLVGNLSTGVGGVANQYSFATLSGKALAVTDEGVVYHWGPGVGIVRIAPNSSQVQLLIPETGVETDGAIGTASVASSNGGHWMQLDSQNRLYFARITGNYIWSGLKIRRFDPDTNTVETVINSTSEGTARVSGTSGTSFKPVFSGLGAFGSVPYLAPNGDLYFYDTPVNTNISNVKFWHYVDATGLVQEITIPNLTSLSGYSQPGGTWTTGYNFAGDYRIWQSAWSFNSDSTVKNFFIFGILLSNSTQQAIVAFDGNYQNASQAQSRNFGVFVRAIYPGRDGKAYRTWSSWDLAEAREDDTTLSAFNRVAGPNALPPDGSPANTNGGSGAGHYEITSTGRIYFIEQGTLRFVDESGLVRTYMGQAVNGGDNALSLNVKIAGAAGIYPSNRGFLFVDESDKIFEHDFSNSSIRLRAGDGQTGVTDLSKNAKETGAKVIASGGSLRPAIGYNPTNDSIYTGASVSGIGDVIVEISSTGVISKLMGGSLFGVSDTYFNVANGTVGLDINTSATVNGRYIKAAVVGFDSDSGQLLTMHGQADNGPPSEYVNSLLMQYNFADQRVYNYAGLFSGNSEPYTVGVNVGTFSADGTQIANSGVPHMFGVNQIFRGTQYDGANPPVNGGPRFIATEHGSGRVVALSTDNTQTLRTIAQIPGGTEYLTYVRKASGNFIYICKNGILQRAPVLADDGSTLVFTTLALPIGVTCNSYSSNNSSGHIYYDQGRKSIIFPVRQNGFFGIAEYYDP